MKVPLLFFLIAFHAFGATPPAKDLEKQLKDAIANRPEARRIKERNINRLFKIHQQTPLPSAYRINEQLADAYANFRIDSAAWYLEQNLFIAKSTGRNDLRNHTAIRLSTFYALLGKFREAEQLLNTVPTSTLPKHERGLFYRAYERYLDYYAINDNKAYAAQIRQYRDSTLALLDTSSVQYRTALAEKLLDQNDLAKAGLLLQNWLENLAPQDESYALTAYLLGNTYTRLHHRPQAKYYFTLSAIAELNSAAKANASLQKLATIYFYGEGDLDMANELTKCALEDAAFSNVRFRMFQVARFSEEVTNAYQQKEHRQKSQLLILLGIVSLLTLASGWAATVIFGQKKRAVTTAAELSLLNKQLAESGRVKEAYISNFFEWCSAYIDKLSHYRKQLLKKAISKQGDELIAVLKSDSLEKQELAELYKTFDTVFLSIYPGFVAAFNELLVPGAMPPPKTGELLSPMLRVFALIRLGITDSAKIASFLRYSPSTVYNYRTKGRNMATGNREDFEARVMEIGEQV